MNIKIETKIDSQSHINIYFSVQMTFTANSLRKICLILPRKNQNAIFICAEKITRRYRASIQRSFVQLMLILANKCSNCWWGIITSFHSFEPWVVSGWNGCVSGVVACLLAFIDADTTVKCICNDIGLLLAIISSTVEISLKIANVGRGNIHVTSIVRF